MALILVGGLVAYVIYMRGYSEEAKAKAEIRRRMKDPDSVVFRDVHYPDILKEEVCGEFNAKNGFGGYVGYKRFVYKKSEKAVYIESLDSNFDLWWGLYCD